MVELSSTALALDCCERKAPCSSTAASTRNLPVVWNWIRLKVPHAQWAWRGPAMFTAALGP